MKLISKSELERLPRFDATLNDRNPMVWAKFFDPWSHWTWYVIEFDGNNLFYGFVQGFVPELGYFSLSELEEYSHDRVERDRYFQPCRLNELREQ